MVRRNEARLHWVCWIRLQEMKLGCTVVMVFAGIEVDVKVTRKRKQIKCA